MLYQHLGDGRKAIDLYNQSIVVSRSQPSPPVTNREEAETLTRIGDLLAIQDTGVTGINRPDTAADIERAIEFYRQSLEIYRDLKAKGSRSGMVGEAITLLNLGNAYKSLGLYAESLSNLEQSLKLNKELRYQPGQISALRSLGGFYSSKGEYTTSLEYFSQALALVKAGFDNSGRAGILHNLARDHNAAGDVKRALELYNEALALSRARQQQGTLAATHYEIARIERDRGNFANARTNIEEAIAIVESIRAAIANEETRSTYFASVKRYYDFFIDLQMQAHKSLPEKGYDALAFETSEKSRSRTMTDLLIQARIDIRQGVDPALLARERQARAKLADIAYKQNVLLLTKHTQEDADEMSRAVTVQTDEYQALQGEIRNKSPRYAALVQPLSVSLKQIQQLLDPGTILLEYSLGGKKSYLWAVMPDSITSFDLPGRDELEKHARRVYRLMTERNRQDEHETTAQAAVRTRAADAEYPRVAAALSDMLLGPAADLIRNKRLLIVPDGALNYLSFSALPLPKGQDFGIVPAMPLGAYHEVVTLPSASTLARLREETVGRRPAEKMVAIFADPVFGSTDMRGASQRKDGQCQKCR